MDTRIGHLLPRPGCLDIIRRRPCTLVLPPFAPTHARLLAPVALRRLATCSHFSHRRAEASLPLTPPPQPLRKCMQPECHRDKFHEAGELLLMPTSFPLRRTLPGKASRSHVLYSSAGRRSVEPCNNLARHPGAGKTSIRAVNGAADGGAAGVAGMTVSGATKVRHRPWNDSTRSRCPSTWAQSSRGSLAVAVRCQRTP